MVEWNRFYQIKERSAPLKAYSFLTFTFCCTFISSISIQFCQVIMWSNKSSIIIQWKNISLVHFNNDIKYIFTFFFGQSLFSKFLDNLFSILSCKWKWNALKYTFIKIFSWKLLMEAFRQQMTVQIDWDNVNLHSE